MDEVFWRPTCQDKEPLDSHNGQLAYMRALQMDLDTGIIDIIDPRVFATKVHADPDQPSFHQAIHGKSADEYIDAMKKEVMALLKYRTWVMVPRSQAKNVIKSTWAFKLK